MFIFLSILDMVLWCLLILLCFMLFSCHIFPNFNAYCMHIRYEKELQWNMPTIKVDAVDLAALL